ncbi:PREDICTED: uncharacterized protein LOC109213062 [Nicotiana attenuata]|uniref:uncharacterized protein LOC109213062 n=1 Tax=Nicotiana attenuata TaxID=49451 RepID=UPI0009047A65|nr:PREDICTED: uncharacterized protein LOC109213062 [Nicotiana attenuata]
MSNLSKLEFVALDISGKNYLSWVLDAEIHLAAKTLENTIIQGNEASGQDKAKAMIFLRHHLGEGLKTEYLTLKDPFELWSSLKERYDHLKATVLPKARYEWIHLRLQDFKTVGGYNSDVFRITSLLKLCGEIVNDEDLLQQYREKSLKKYSELISCLLVAEQHNTLLMKNHETRPTGSAPFSEVNMENNKDPQNNSLKGRVNICHRCGMEGHWARVCRTPDHFVKLYQASIKRKDNNVETHLTYQNNDDEAGPSNKYDDVEANLAYKDDDFGGLANITHLEAGDFFEDSD